jgi:hypothetical protein
MHILGHSVYKVHSISIHILGHGAYNVHGP